MTESQIVERLLPRKSQQTPAYQIFHFYFPCRIQNSHRYTPEALKEVGLVSSGDRAIDRAQALQFVDVTLSIAGIAEYLSQGVAVQLTRSEDSAKIYRIIKQHLDNWLHFVRSNVHCIESPDDDLRKLDELATEIYPHAKYFMVETPFHGTLADSLASIILARGGQKKVLQSENATNVKAAREQMVPVHTPMADSIAQHTLSRRGSWPSKTPR